jgi:hypothetical protein
MTRRDANTAILAGAAVLVAGPASATQETETIALPLPRSKGGKPLIEALMLRRSTREYSERPLPLQVLSDLLYGRRSASIAPAVIGRRRTGATSWSSTSTQLWRTAYGSMSQSGTRCCRNLASTSGSKPAFRISSGQLRSISSTSPTASACRTFRLKSDASMLRSIPGFIGQNVYLFCASEGLGTVFRGAVDYDSSVELCNLVPINSSHSRRPSVTCGVSAGPQDYWSSYSHSTGNCSPWVGK